MSLIPRAAPLLLSLRSEAALQAASASHSGMTAPLASLKSWLLLACCSLVHASTSSHLIEGRVDIPAQIQHLVHHNDISVLLALNGGAELRAFAKPDGSFVFHNVPAGTHMLDVVAMHLMYPQVRLDVSHTGEATAAFAEDNMQLVESQPLVLRPAAKAEYYEKRPPFSLRSLIMSPYGLMIGFMVFAMFIMPKLKVDPEEMKEMLGQKETAPEQEKVPTIKGRQHR